MDLKQDVLVLDERLHHLPLMAYVVEGCHGVQIRRSHEGRPEDDAEVLRVHQVVLLILGHPEINRKNTYNPLVRQNCRCMEETNSQTPKGMQTLHPEEKPKDQKDQDRSGRKW